jgi:hypothetical protein
LSVLFETHGGINKSVLFRCLTAESTAKVLLILAPNAEVKPALAFPTRPYSQFKNPRQPIPERHSPRELTSGQRQASAFNRKKFSV